MWMAGLQAEYEFLKRDAVRTSDPKHPGRKEFLCEGFRSERQLRRRGGGRHRAETRLLRRSTIETRDPVTRSSLSMPRLICSWPL